MRKIMSRIKGAINSVFIKTKNWKDIEYFDESWKKRISEMSDFISPGKTVMDLGCGKMWLKEYLDETNTYIPVDYIKRNPETITCDFNKYEFPELATDIIFISGTLEYIRNYKWFLRNVCSHAKKVILSYCTIDDFPDKNERRYYSWANHLSKQMVIDLFKKGGFQLTNSLSTLPKNRIFIFEKHEDQKLYCTT